MFKDLINEYTILFNEKSIDVLCKYFGFDKPQTRKKEIVKEIILREVSVSVEQTKTDNMPLSLFDFAS